MKILKMVLLEISSKSAVSEIQHSLSGTSNHTTFKITLNLSRSGVCLEYETHFAFDYGLFDIIFYD